MNESDTYREWAPPAAWRGTVACLWEQQVHADLDHRVVPDGCADVIVTPGGVVAVGVADQAVVHRLGAGSWCRGLRLRPESIATFFGVPAEELRNQELPLDDVVGSARARHLVDTVLDGAPDPVLAHEPPEDVTRALALLRRASVDDAAGALGMSARNLHRLVTRHVGLSPKTYQRVVRLRRFLDDDRPLAVAAAHAGYADQSHLTREVRQLCGLPPAALRLSRTAARGALPDEATRRPAP